MGIDGCWEITCSFNSDFLFTKHKSIIYIYIQNFILNIFTN